MREKKKKKKKERVKTQEVLLHNNNDICEGQRRVTQCNSCGWGPHAE